jgi:hypothetical protein
VSEVPTKGRLDCLALSTRPGVEVDLPVVKVRIFDGVEEIYMAVQQALEGVGARKIGMRSNDQASLFAASSQVGEGPHPIRWPLGVDDQHMPVLHPGLHPGDQQNSVPEGVIPQLLRIGYRLVIGDGKDLKALFLSFGD